jgi:hypothetical protein
LATTPPPLTRPLAALGLSARFVTVVSSPHPSTSPRPYSEQAHPALERQERGRPNHLWHVHCCPCPVCAASLGDARTATIEAPPFYSTANVADTCVLLKTLSTDWGWCCPKWSLACSLAAHGDASKVFVGMYVRRGCDPPREQRHRVLSWCGCSVQDDIEIVFGTVPTLTSKCSSLHHCFHLLCPHPFRHHALRTYAPHPQLKLHVPLFQENIQPPRRCPVLARLRASARSRRLVTAGLYAMSITTAGPSR